MSAKNYAKEFFEKYVIPNLHEWRKSPADERLAMNLIGSLNSLVDHYWIFSLENDPSKVFNKNKLSEYRAELSKLNLNIGLVRDVADAHKHFKLGRADRNLTSAEQTAPQNMGYGRAYGVCYGGGELLVTTLDNSSEVYFSVVAESAYEYWLNELK